MTALHDIGVAVVGAGFIGPVHVEALRRLGLPIRGILGCDDAESQRAMKSLGLPKAYRNLDEVLADPNVQAVHLAVPNVLHYEFAKKAITAGKHVLCEKPLAMTSKESGELVELAKGKKLAAAVCYNVRFYPLNLEARDRVARGEVGQIYAVNGSYTQDWLFYDTDYNWRVLSDQGGVLRAVADIGTHWMDLVTSITGLEVDSVFADLNIVHPIRKRPKGEVETYSGKLATERETEPVKIDTEDYGNVLFRFKNGARGSLWVSQVTAGRKNCIRYEIAGAK
ncbi:MAG TPA: Gfo/Idh/MocA family oxidoreductase, partial [Pirellulales bacterium]